MKQRGKYQNSTHFISQSLETCNSSADIYSSACVDSLEEALHSAPYAQLQAQIQNLIAIKLEEESRSVTVCQQETLRVAQCADCIEIHALVLNKGEIQEMKRLRQENRWLRTRNEELQTQLQASNIRIRNIEDISENNDHLSHQLYLRIKQLQHQRKEIQQLQLGMHHRCTIIQQLQQEVQTNQSIIQNLLEKLRQPQEKIVVIKQVPVYIEKDVLIEVAVPIYINQKRQQKNYNLLTINQSIFQSQNSISMAINELSAQMEPSQANSDTKKSNFKFGNSKSFQASDIYEDEKSFTGSKNPRQKRVKQIVEVPVYIEKEVIKEVQKVVIVEKEVIKYVYAQESQASQEGQLDRHAATWHGHSAFADFAHIQEESMESKESLREEQSARDVWNRHSSIAQRVQQSDHSHQGHSQKEIIIQVPVQVEKQVIVIKEVFLPFEVPTEIILEKEIIVQKVIQKGIPIEKIIYVDRQVVVEKEIIVQKQVIVEKIIQKIVPHQIIIEKVVGLDVGKTKTHRNMRVQPNLPEDITLHFDLQDNMIINKIFVTEEGASSQYLQKSMMIREFVSRESIGEKVRVEYVEVPVQIILDQRVRKSEDRRDVQVQVDLGEKPMEIIVEKVIYLNERYQNHEDRDDLYITLGREKPRREEKDMKEGQIIVEKIIEVEVQKIVEMECIKYQTIPIEIPTEIIIEKLIYIPKEIYIQRPIIIYQQIQNPIYQRPQECQKNPDPQIRISQTTEQGLNLCIPLTDRSQSSAHQKQENSPYKNYDHFEDYEGERELYEIKEVNYRREQQYQEDLERCQEEMRCTQDRLMEMGQENQALVAEIKKLRVQNNSLHTTINEMSSVFEITIIRERQSMHEIIQEEIKKREIAEAQAEDAEKLVLHLKERLHYEKNSSSYLEVRIKNQQKAHQNQQKELLRQIQVKNQQIQELFQAHQQEIKHSKYYEERLIQQKSMIESQLTEIRNELQVKSGIEEENKQLFQEKFLELLRHHEEMKCEYEQKIETIELQNKREMEQLVAKNQENVNQKKSKIAELEKTIRGIQMRENRAKNSPSIERNNQKINVKIINLQNQAKKSNGIREGFQTKGEEELYEENQRFLQVIDNLNDQIGKLNDRINLLQDGSRNHSGHLQTRSKIKSFYFNQFQPQKITEKIPKTRIRIQQLGQSGKRSNQAQSNDSLAAQLLSKRTEIQRFKELITSYQEVIEDLQGQLISIHQQDQRSSYYAEPTSQSRHWAKKIILLQQQLKFQKSEKLKASIRIREYQRMIAEFNYNQTYSEDDTELIERLMHQLQQEKTKTFQLRKENERLRIQVKRQEGQIAELQEECISARKARDNLLLDQLQQIDRKFEGQFGYEISTLKKYQNYKIKYVKILELSQLIKEQLANLQPKLPKTCQQSLNRIHRFLTIIQNNQKNSSSPPRPSKSRSRALQPRDEDLLYSELLSLAS